MKITKLESKEPLTAPNPLSMPEHPVPPEILNSTELKLEEKVIEVLKTCFDPEIPVNIYELGLIYEIDAPFGDPEDKTVKILMTLTSPMCPVAESLPPEVEQKIRQIPEVNTAQVELTWDPPWSPEKMSEAAQLQLNLP